MRDDGEIGVVNLCRKESLDREEDSAAGRAVAASTNVKLEAAFFSPFWGEGWVFDHGDDYDHADVGCPSRDCLWILPRTPPWAESVCRGIIDRLRAKGSSLERLQTTLEPAKSWTSEPSGD